MLYFRGNGDIVEANSCSVRTRTRSGCLQCRGRRRKCDGRHPRCRGCEARNLTCLWGLKASFHPSRNTSLSRREASVLNGVEEGRRRRSSRSRNHRFIDETKEIVNEYRTARRSSEGLEFTDGEEQENSSPHLYNSPQPVNSGDIGIADVFTQYNQRASEIPAGPRRTDNISSTPEPRHFNIVSTFAESVENNYGHSFPISRGSSNYETPQPTPQLPVTSREKIRLISAYLRDTGTWCETTDSQMHFTVKSVHKMMKSPPFAAAAISLASRQLDYLQGQHRPVTLELYQFTIQSLLCHNPAEADACILATCTLLSVYEMMASPVEEWRRHLRGCAGFLRNKRWNGSSDGIVKASFWAFARIDIWAAFNSGKATLIPTESWVDDDCIHSVYAKGDLDDYCNLAILIFAKIVNLLSTTRGLKGRARATSLKSSLCSLWEEMQDWRLQRPREAYPLLRDTEPSKPFPEVLYSRSSPNCGNTFYHAGCMLLLQDSLVKQGSKFEYASARGEDIGDAIWHARELMGISISNQSHVNWVNQLQPLFIAGTLFGTSELVVQDFETSVSLVGELDSLESPDSDKFCAEKIILLKHLAKIERETGWKTSDRAAELRSLWGFA